MPVWALALVSVMAVHFASGVTAVAVTATLLAMAPVAPAASAMLWVLRSVYSVAPYPIAVRSVVIEQGSQGGKPYRFESVEEFLLERRAGAWRATGAQTTQR